jgi:hypothetical protein
MALHIGTALPLWIDIDLEIPIGKGTTSKGGRARPHYLPLSAFVHKGRVIVIALLLL